MALRESRLTLLLALALLMVCLALASGRIPHCKHFLWKHWDYQRYPPQDPDAYCNKMMWEKGIPEKPKHTFIHDDIWKIKNVCSGGGKPIGGGWFVSKSFFSITKCTRIPTDRFYTGQSKFKKIILRCWCKVPVDILECMKGSPWGWKADGEQCESCSIPSSLYMDPNSSSASEHCAEDSDYPSPPPSAAFSAHCGE